MTESSERSRAEVEAVLQGRSRRAAAFSLVREASLIPVLVVLIIVGALINPAFLTVSNFSGIGQQVSALGVTVVGESLILLIGGMGLSLEGTYALAPAVCAGLIVPTLWNASVPMLSPHHPAALLLPPPPGLCLGSG